MWAAHSAREHGGSAVLWRACPSSSAEHDALVRQARESRAPEYQDLVAAAEAAADLEGPDRIAAVRRLRSTLRAIKRRDHFPDEARDRAEAAIETVAASPSISPAAIEEARR